MLSTRHRHTVDPILQARPEDAELENLQYQQRNRIMAIELGLDPGNADLPSAPPVTDTDLVDVGLSPAIPSEAAHGCADYEEEAERWDGLS